MRIGDVAIGKVVKLVWNGEAVQIVDQWNMCAKIRSLGEVKAEREVSTGTDVDVFDGYGLLGRCACGCGRIVEGERRSRKYATRACKYRAFRQKTVAQP